MTSHPSYTDIYFSEYDLRTNKEPIKVIVEMKNAPNSDDLVDIGEEHHKAGRLQDAESYYQKALEVDPGHPGALYFLANIAYDDGRLEFASQLIEQLLRDEPNDAEAWNLSGMIAFRKQDFPESIECFNKALALQPGYALAHYGLGSALSGQGESDRAIECFQKALSFNPGLGEAYFGLGNIFLGKNQLDEAIKNFRQAITSNFDVAHAHVGLAKAFIFNNQYTDAKASLDRAISLDPNCADAYRSLGLFFAKKEDFLEAEHAFRRACELMPQDAHFRHDLAVTLKYAGKVHEAIDCLKEVIAMNPSWANAHSNLLALVQYLPDYPREKIFAEHAAFGEQFEAPLRENWPRYSQAIDPHKRLRVGFVSADLYSHPVGYFLEGVLRELYRRDRLDIIVYEMNLETDELTERLRATTHAWHSVSTLSLDDLERRIHEDNIDILVDLSGHIVPHRLLVFARKPAPIQVTWLGYWETTGLRAIDYILCDRHGVQDDEEKYFVEKPWYLPHTRLCFTLPNEAIPVAPLPALINGSVTFGCFNNLVKMTDRVVSVWSAILKRVPNSRLFLKATSFINTSARESVAARFLAEGISADRLELEAASPRREYFSAYNRVDIALDPFPFPGGTTSIEGIWMGVPMISMRGDRIITRQGEGILFNLGLQDWIAADEDEYIELAVQHAADLSSLAKLRSQLREKLEGSPLCDTKLFAQHLEEAYTQMWEKFCENPTTNTQEDNFN